jgi:hypothetical protein
MDNWVKVTFEGITSIQATSHVTDEQLLLLRSPNMCVPKCSCHTCLVCLLQLSTISTVETISPAPYVNRHLIDDLSNQTLIGLHNYTCIPYDFYGEFVEHITEDEEPFNYETEPSLPKRVIRNLVARGDSLRLYTYGDISVAVRQRTRHVLAFIDNRILAVYCQHLKSWLDVLDNDNDAYRAEEILKTHFGIEGAHCCNYRRLIGSGGTLGALYP